MAKKSIKVFLEYDQSLVSQFTKQEEFGDVQGNGTATAAIVTQCSSFNEFAA